jgi:hypothetical protein
MISYGYNGILQRVSIQEKRSLFGSHVVLYGISENMIKIAGNRFSAVPFSEWTCGDLHSAISGISFEQVLDLIESEIEN